MSFLDFLAGDKLNYVEDVLLLLLEADRHMAEL